MLHISYYCITLLVGLPDWLRNLQASLLYTSYHCSALVALHLDLGNLDCCIAFGNCFLGLPMINWGDSSNLDCNYWNKVSAAPCTSLLLQQQSLHNALHNWDLLM